MRLQILCFAIALTFTGQLWGSAVVSPTLVQEPVDQQVQVGEWAYFGCYATGTWPLLYQWRFNGQDLPDQTYSYINRHITSTNMGGNYQVVVSNAAGVVTSRVAVLKVTINPPQIAKQPENQTVDRGNYVRLYVEAAGTQPIRFQWWHNNQPVPNATEYSLSFPQISSSQAGRYHVTLSNSRATITSEVATVTVLSRPPQIIRGPEDQVVNVGDWVYHRVDATGAQPFFYQWRFNGKDIPGAMDYNYYPNTGSTNSTGNYDVVVKNVFGAVTSAVARLSVLLQPPRITQHPVSRTADTGSELYLQVGVSGSPPFTFQWQKDGKDLVGEINDSLHFTFLTTNHAGNYRVVVNNTSGMAASDEARLTVVSRPPAITQQPSSRTVDAGSWAGFSVTASGSPPLGYQWQLDEQNMEEATSPYLNFYPVSIEDEGNYRIVITNAYGAVTSSVAALKVLLHPPSITYPLQSRTVTSGTEVSFTVGVSGTHPLFYQWLKNSSPLIKETNSLLWLRPVALDHEGAYQVIITNAFGAVTSGVATLTVLNRSPEIVQQPANQTTEIGGWARFSVGAEGSLPLFYQWRFNGMDVPGCTNTYLDFSYAGAHQAGDYDVVVRNPFGVITSAVAQLRFRTEPPSITWDPQDVTVAWGTSTSLGAGAAGSPPLSVQWQMGGTNLPGAMEVTLPLNAVTFQNAGYYRMIASNAFGMATSAVASVVVTAHPPYIREHPGDQIVSAGESAVIRVLAAGAYPLYYQWQFNAQNIPGANESSLQPATSWTNGAGEYRVIVSNFVGVVTSDVARLIVRVFPPVFTHQPKSQTVDWGTSVGFLAAVYGTGPVRFQWLHNGKSLPGATNDWLSLQAVTTNAAGNYQLVASNPLGSATSSVARLTVLVRAPIITCQPTDQVADAGERCYFSVQADGAHPLHYQWHFKGRNIPGAKEAELYRANVGPNDAGGYRVVVSNRVGVVTSQVARLTVRTYPPAIVQQPGSQVADWGQDAWFSVYVSGSPVLFFQWQRDGLNMAGATNRDLFIPAATTSNAGRYQVVVSNTWGVVTSAVATLTVNVRPPQITYQPINQMVDVGSWYYFTVGAVGARPFSYQWQFNGQNIPGATSDNLSGTAYWTNNAGDYRVIVSNFAGVVTSAVARLTVSVYPPQITRHPEGRTVEWGSTVNFSAQVAGSSPLRYQWQCNGRPISVTDSPQLYLASVTTNHAGDYRVVVSNPLGKATSAVARLTVQSRAPQIIAQPQGATVDAGQSWNTMVGAVGAQPLSYQWQFNGRNLPDAVYPHFYVPEALTNHAGEYQVTVSNFLGVVTSEVARLTVVQHPPEISEQPTSLVVDAGSQFHFAVGVSSTPPLHFQWRRNGVNLPDGTNSYFGRNAATTNHAGRYRVVVSNALGVVTSEVATLTVRLHAPVIIQHPEDIVADAGSDVCLSASASAAPRPIFYWQHQGKTVLRITNSSGPYPSLGSLTGLPLSSITSNNAGNYRVIASNSLGAATSAVAKLTVRYRPPVILSHPSSLSVQAGNEASFYCSAVGGPPPRFQWYHNGKLLPGQTNDSMHFAVQSTNQGGGYTVVARNACGSVTSAVAVLTVGISPPGFMIHPLSRGTVSGNRVDFWVYTYGDPSPALQWQHNGRDITNASDRVLSLDNVTTNDAGIYRVIARNESGEAVSQEATLTVAAPGPLDHWQWRNPLPQGNDLRGLTHGNGILVAVGNRGARIRSQDGGVNWQSTSTDDLNVDTVVFGNGVFVASGCWWYQSAEPTVLSSSDGIGWAKHSLVAQPFEGITGLTFGNKRFVAVGGRGTCWVSTNGIDWTRHLEASRPQLRFASLSYGKGIFVAALQCGDSFQPVMSIATSADGLAWTFKDFPQFTYDNGPVFGGGRFLVYHSGYYGQVTSALVSGDGIQWTNQSLNRVLWHSPVIFGANRFLTIPIFYGPGLTSSDGINWSETNTGPSNLVFALRYDGTRSVAVGNRGTISTSTNGNDWITHSPGSAWKLNGIAYGNNRFVAVGDGGLVRTSPDGQRWTRQPSPTSVNLHGVAFGNGSFVAVGGVTEDFQAEILISNDGVTWTRIRGVIFSALHGITFGYGKFLAVGEIGVIATSADGLAWTTQYTIPGERLYAITCGGGKFVAVGDRNSIFTSNGEEPWKAQYAPGSTSLRSIAWGNGRFVAGGQYGTMIESLDGATWVEMPALTHSFFGSPDIEEIQFINGIFVAAGTDGLLATSTNAAFWIEHRTGCQHALRSMLDAGGYLTAVGDSETILQSDFFGPPRLQVRAMRAGQGFEFSVGRETGRPCHLQASEDLVNWEDMFEFGITNRTTLFLDPDGLATPHRFYRLVSPQD